MKFPKHISLSLTHNEHLNYYATVKDELETTYKHAQWVSEEQKQKAIDTNDCWALQFYPDTPIGFYVIAAADLDLLLEFCYAADT